VCPKAAIRSAGRRSAGRYGPETKRKNDGSNQNTRRLSRHPGKSRMGYWLVERSRTGYGSMAPGLPGCGATGRTLRKPHGVCNGHLRHTFVAPSRRPICTAHPVPGGTEAQIPARSSSRSTTAMAAQPVGHALRVLRWYQHDAHTTPLRTMHAGSSISFFLSVPLRA
jgi:hypothetical protein